MENYAHVTWWKPERNFVRVWKFSWTQATEEGILHVLKKFVELSLINFLECLRKHLGKGKGEKLFVFYFFYEIKVTKCNDYTSKY